MYNNINIMLLDYQRLNPSTVTDKYLNQSAEKVIKKTIIFCDDIMETHRIVEYLGSLVEPSEKDAIDCYHSDRTELAKAWSMRNFVEGRTRILIATEAAGMVSDRFT